MDIEHGKTHSVLISTESAGMVTCTEWGSGLGYDLLIEADEEPKQCLSITHEQFDALVASVSTCRLSSFDEEVEVAQMDLLECEEMDEDEWEDIPDEENPRF